MSGTPLETCWAFSERWNNKFYYKVASCWLFLLIHSTMHGSMNIKFVHLWVCMQTLQEQHARTLLSSTTCYWGYLPRLATKRPSRAVARCGSAEWDLFMLHAWWCSTTFSYCSSRILEQRVSGRMCKTRWTNNMACPFPTFNPLDFYLWRHLKSAVYATEVHHRLAMNKERISDDSSTPGIFQGVRLSLLRRATSCVEDQHWRHFLYNQGSRKSENMLQKAYNHKTFLYVQGFGGETWGKETTGETQA